MAGASVRKGKSFERVVANTLGAIYAVHESLAGRTLAPGDRPVRRGLAQSRGGGAEEPDVVVGDLDLHVEVKHHNTIAPSALMRQALADVRRSGTADTLTLGVLKRDRQEPTAYLFAWDAQRLLGWWHGYPVPRVDPVGRGETRRGPLVRPYGGSTPLGLGTVPPDIGPVVEFTWRELVAILDGVWEHLPRKRSAAP